MTLVSIPWQPQMLVHPDFLAKLEAASGHLGRDIYLGAARSPGGEYLAAWRSRAGTVYLWHGYVDHLPGFSSASNPDNGPRSHQRGVGGDLQSWAPDIYAALRWAGIQVNGVRGEPWHIQLPNFMSYPIINDRTTTAGSGGTRIGDNELSAAEVQQIIQANQAMHDVTRQYLDGIIRGTGDEVKAVVRRESRMRLYQNTATKQFMTADIATGRYEILSGQSEVDSLKYNGYLEIASEEIPQQVDQQRWDNIIAKCPVNIKAL